MQFLPTYVLDTPAANKPLQLATVKAHLRIVLNNEDDYLNMLIDAATSYAEKYLGRDLINKTWRAYFNKFCTDFLIKKSKLQSISSVKYLKDNVWQTVDASVYRIMAGTDYSLITLNADKVWPTDADPLAQAVEIKFVSGYGVDHTAIPGDIKLGLLNHVAAMYEERGDCSDCSCADTLPAHAKAIYRTYRILPVYDKTCC